MGGWGVQRRVEDLVTSGSTTNEGADRDEIFELLSNKRRRFTIHYCKRQDEPATLSELAEHGAAWELDKPVQEITSSERKRVYTALQQTHLPTLERAGMIDFDGHTVSLTDEAADLEVYLDIVPGDSIPWGPYYLGLAVLALAVFGGIWTGLVPTEPISAPVIGAFFAVVLGVSALIHSWTGRGRRLEMLERPEEQ